MGFVPIKKICWAYDMEAPMLHLGLGFAYIQRSRTLLRCCAGLNFYPARANTFLHDAKHTEVLNHHGTLPVIGPHFFFTFSLVHRLTLGFG